jgi:hypothetical protein
MKSFHAVSHLCLILALVAFSWLAGQAYAGFTDVYVYGPEGYDNPYYEWDGENTPELLDVWETWEDSFGSSYDLTVGGTTDEDPVLTITKNILNSTSFTWFGYTITLDPDDDDTFVGLPTSGGTSGGMTLGTQTDTLLEWTTPNPVLPGQTVSFTFDVNVPDEGIFDFTLSQSPIVPEPASITLAGLAMLLLAACRRRFA